MPQLSHMRRSRVCKAKSKKKKKKVQKQLNLQTKSKRLQFNQKRHQNKETRLYSSDVWTPAAAKYGMTSGSKLRLVRMVTWCSATKSPVEGNQSPWVKFWHGHTLGKLFPIFFLLPEVTEWRRRSVFLLAASQTPAAAAVVLMCLHLGPKLRFDRAVKKPERTPHKTDLGSELTALNTSVRGVVWHSELILNQISQRSDQVFY